MRADLLSLASDLARRGEAFALATVVRREPPSSARVGDSALVTASGEFHGWLGGSCTTPTTIREALAALADGTPRLVALTPDPDADRRAGITVLPMICHSGGSVDIYIEPVLPAPRLAVFGNSPVAQALSRLGNAVHYAVDVIDPDADRASFPLADRVITSLDAPELRLLAGSHAGLVFAVVATMGQSDEDAIEAALRLKPAYLGVVASRRRYSELRETAKARGASEAALAHLRCPAGLDIGARAPEEIAVSILAEIVQSRRAADATGGAVASAGGTHAAPAASAHAPSHHTPPSAAAPRKPLPLQSEAATPAEAEAIDPVCKMTVNIARAKHKAEIDGRMWYFCCNGCKEKFTREPQRYLAAAGESR